MPEWDAEITWTEALIREEVAAVRPDLADLPLEPLGEGFDNVAVRLGDWVFRFPRRSFGGDAMAIELRWLPELAPELTLPIPVPEIIGAPSERSPWPWGGFRYVAGTTADRANLGEADRAALTEPLAEILASLHRIPVPDDAPPDTITRHDHRRRAPKVIERLAGLAADDSGELGALAARAIPFTEELRELPPWDESPVWCHGDLYARHLLVDDGALVGVIDWGDLHAGDRAVDLSIAWSFLPPSEHERFRARYAACLGGAGEVDPVVWARARFRAIHYGAALGEYGRAIDEPALEETARIALRSALPPDGD